MNKTKNDKNRTPDALWPPHEHGHCVPAYVHMYIHHIFTPMNNNEEKEEEEEEKLTAVACL